MFLLRGFLLGLLPVAWVAMAAEQQAPPLYSAMDDASWAIQSEHLSPILDPHKQHLYDEYIANCGKAVEEAGQPDTDCVKDDRFRILMNREQPRSVYNFTKAGYKKIRAPPTLFEMIRNFYEANKGNDEVEWNRINTYHNMWEAPPTIVHLNQYKNKGGGASLQTSIWHAAKDILEEWSGQELSPVSLYGIRLYHNNSILAPHVDRFPLIVSAIINIDQSLEEDWPLEVYGHDGRATNVSMVPGDMVLYESHSVVHGRPFPMRGDYYANVFMHFEAVGPLDEDGTDLYDPEEDIPPYLVAGSSWAAEWKKQFPGGWREKYEDGVEAARKGDVAALRRVARIRPEAFARADANGWLPLHEAVRVGHVDAVRVILGTAPGQVSQRTGAGQTPLDIALQFLGEDHPLTAYLLSLGATSSSGGAEL